VVNNPGENETPVNLQALGEEAINSPTAINTPLLPVYEVDRDYEVAQINAEAAVGSTDPNQPL
jgi:hypothetical protein